MRIKEFLEYLDILIDQLNSNETFFTPEWRLIVMDESIDSSSSDDGYRPNAIEEFHEKSIADPEFIYEVEDFVINWYNRNINFFNGALGRSLARDDALYSERTIGKPAPSVEHATSDITNCLKVPFTWELFPNEILGEGGFGTVYRAYTHYKPKQRASSLTEPVLFSKQSTYGKVFQEKNIATVHLVTN